MSFRDSLLQRIVATDYQYVDGVQTLSMYRPSTAETWTDIKGCLQTVKDKERAGTLGIQKVDQMLHLFATTMSVEPKPADEFTDEGGTIWIVGPEVFTQQSIGSDPVYYDVGCTRKIT